VSFPIFFWTAPPSADARVLLPLRIDFPLLFLSAQQKPPLTFAPLYKIVLEEAYGLSCL